MANYLATEGKNKAAKVLLFESIFIVISTVLAWLITEQQIALAVLFGGLMNLIPNAIFALLAFRYSGARQSEQVVRSFSQGAKLKIIITMTLAIVAFYGLSLPPLPLFASFIAITVSHWLLTVIMQTTTK